MLNSLGSFGASAARFVATAASFGSTSIFVASGLITALLKVFPPKVMSQLHTVAPVKSLAGYVNIPSTANPVVFKKEHFM